MAKPLIDVFKEELVEYLMPEYDLIYRLSEDHNIDIDPYSRPEVERMVEEVFDKAEFIWRQSLPPGDKE